MRKNSAFTLIELMVTLAVVAVILAISVPAFRDFVLNNRRAAQVNELITSLNLARSEALKRSTTVTVCRTNDPVNANPPCANGAGWEDGWVVFADVNGDGDFDAGDTVIQTRQALSNATLRGNGPTVNRVTFTALGMSNNVGRLVYCDSRGHGPQIREIVIDAVGRVRSVKGIENSTGCT